MMTELPGAAKSAPAADLVTPRRRGRTGRTPRAIAALAAFALLALPGCATITTDANQLVRVETLDERGAELRGAACRLQNDGGTASVTTPAAVQVRRSAADLSVQCTAPGQPDGLATVTSRVGAGMFGNIVFGGGIGAIIDHSKGTAYNYPTWIQLVMGERLSFDRGDFVEGQATPPFRLVDGQRVPWAPPGAPAPAAAPGTAPGPAHSPAPAPAPASAGASSPAVAR